MKFSVMTAKDLNMTVSDLEHHLEVRRVARILSVKDLAVVLVAKEASDLQEVAREESDGSISQM